MTRSNKPTPVILDTDIGTDIDDTWALALLLKCPEIALKLVVTATGDTPYRAKIVTKMLEAAGRADVPVGIGMQSGSSWGPQAAWVFDHELDAYSGIVRQDGIQAMIDTILETDEQITLIAIGPLTNVAEALRREPSITTKCRFVGMHGSIYKGYNDSDYPAPEYNVFQDIDACRTVFSAPWSVTITPLDTCGIVQLEGDRLSKVRNQADRDALIEALIENDDIWWWQRKPAGPGSNGAKRKSTSTLFDTVAIYLALREDLLRIEDIGIYITDEGFTKPDPESKTIRCATSWKDLDAFKDFIVERYCS